MCENCVTRNKLNDSPAKRKQKPCHAFSISSNDFQRLWFPLKFPIVGECVNWFRRKRKKKQEKHRNTSRQMEWIGFLLIFFGWALGSFPIKNRTKQNTSNNSLDSLKNVSAELLPCDIFICSGNDMKNKVNGNSCQSHRSAGTKAFHQNIFAGCAFLYVILCEFEWNAVLIPLEWLYFIIRWEKISVSIYRFDRF